MWHKELSWAPCQCPSWSSSELKWWWVLSEKYQKFDQSTQARLGWWLATMSSMYTLSLCPVAMSGACIRASTTSELCIQQHGVVGKMAPIPFLQCRSSFSLDVSRRMPYTGIPRNAAWTRIMASQGGRLNLNPIFEIVHQTCRLYFWVLGIAHKTLYVIHADCYPWSSCALGFELLSKPLGCTCRLLSYPKYLCFWVSNYPQKPINYTCWLLSQK